MTAEPSWPVPQRDLLTTTVLTLDEASRLTSRSHVHAQLVGHRWQQPVAGVVVRHNGPLSPDEHQRIALLAAPPGAVLGGLTALEHAGLEGFPDDATTIVVPGSSRRPHPMPDVRLRWSTELSDADVHPGDPPRTRAARSAVDAAGERVGLGRARVLLIAACQQSLTTADRLDDALSRRGPCRNRAVIRETVTDVRGGLQSLPERDLDRICRDGGLPESSTQRVLRHRSGSYYLDRGWDDYGVACEVHGIPHLQVQRWDADLLRQNEVVIRGPRLLVFSSYAVRHEPDRVLDQLRRMLRRAGWPG